MRSKTIALLVAASLVAAACGGTAGRTSRPVSSGTLEISTRTATPAASGSPAVSASAGTSADDSGAPTDTVWLCRPGLASNPCAGDLTATVVAANGIGKVMPAGPAADPPIDCFYVYPTVSRQKSVNASLAIEPEEIDAARAQAAQFSKACAVYAPIYPQITLAALDDPSSLTLASALIAYSGVRSAFRDYMAHYNNGRGVVFIGHSQGAMMLTRLLQGEVDAVPEARARMVSALLIGGNVAEGDFSNIPSCSTATQTGCVVAYSSFNSTPPADSYFGRSDSPLSLGLGSSGAVLCVNPAAPAGGRAGLDPIFPTGGAAAARSEGSPWPSATTPYVAFPGALNAECKTSSGATYLLVTSAWAMPTGLPSLSPSASNARWGLHVMDVNLALGNLVELVAGQAAAYATENGGRR
jgi:hypothetical protein